MIVRDINVCYTSGLRSTFRAYGEPEEFGDGTTSAVVYQTDAEGKSEITVNVDHAEQIESKYVEDIADPAKPAPRRIK